MTNLFGLRSIGLAALVLGVIVCGCSGKRATANQTSNAMVVTPAAPAPIPIPYPASSAEPRDLATGQASGKRQYSPIKIVK